MTELICAPAGLDNRRRVGGSGRAVLVDYKPSLCAGLARILAVMAIDDPSFFFGAEWWVVALVVWPLTVVLLLGCVVVARSDRHRGRVWASCAGGTAVVAWSFLTFGGLVTADGTACVGMHGPAPATLFGGDACAVAETWHLLLTLGLPTLVMVGAAVFVIARVVSRTRRVGSVPVTAQRQPEG